MVSCFPSISTSYVIGLKRAKVSKVPSVYFNRPLGHLIRLANEFTKASNPVLKTCTYQRSPKDPEIFPRSILSAFDDLIA